MTRTRAQLVDPNCQVTDSDYDAIVSAIMETSRGRWFLTEYARRNRHADTQTILAAFGKMKEAFDFYTRAARPYLVATTLSSAYNADQSQNGAPSSRASKAVLPAPSSSIASAEKDEFDFRMLKSACA